MHEAGNRSRSPFEFPVGYPSAVTFAGIVWIIVGSLILLTMLGLLFIRFNATALLGSSAGRQWEAVSLVAIAIISAILGLIGGGFLFVGIQSVRGTAHDTLGNGVASVIFGLIQLGIGTLLISNGLMIPATITILGGIGLLTAGILALVGRGDFILWRNRIHSTPRTEPKSTQLDRPERTPTQTSSQSDTSITFFASINGAQAGPFNLDEMLVRIRDGSIVRTTLVWRAGMANWSAAESRTELGALFAAVPPPLPPPL